MIKKKCNLCEKLEKINNRIFGRIAWVYALIMGRPSMQGLNNKIFNLCLHAKGFNNCCDLVRSGELTLIKHIAKTNPSLCIDIGANIGEYTEQLLRLSNTKVLAFEPLPKAFRALEDIENRYDSRLTVVNKALGDQECTLQLSFGNEDSVLATLSRDVEQIDYIAVQNTNKIDVNVTTLDRYLKENSNLCKNGINLIKIDTEGFEFEVLTGAVETIKIYKPNFIQIEYNWHQLFRRHSLYNISSLLSDYSVNRILPYDGGLISVDPKEASSNIYCYSNYLFIRK